MWKKEPGKEKVPVSRQEFERAWEEAKRYQAERDRYRQEERNRYQSDRDRSRK